MPQPMTVHTDSGPYGHAAIRSPSLHPRNAIAWITTHLHTPEGGKAELAFALFADHSEKFNHKVVTCQP